MYLFLVIFGLDLFVYIIYLILQYINYNIYINGVTLRLSNMTKVDSKMDIAKDKWEIEHAK